MHSYRRTHRKKRPYGIRQQKLRIARTKDTQNRTQAILDAIGEYHRSRQARV